MAAPSLAGFKARLDGALSTLGWWKGSLPMVGGLELGVPTQTTLRPSDAIPEVPCHFPGARVAAGEQLGPGQRHGAEQGPPPCSTALAHPAPGPPGAVCGHPGQRQAGGPWHLVSVCRDLTENPLAPFPDGSFLGFTQLQRL